LRYPHRDPRSSFVPIDNMYSQPSHVCVHGRMRYVSGRPSFVGQCFVHTHVSHFGSTRSAVHQTNGQLPILTDSVLDCSAYADDTICPQADNGSRGGLLPGRRAAARLRLAPVHTQALVHVTSPIRCSRIHPCSLLAHVMVIYAWPPMTKPCRAAPTLDARHGDDAFVRAITYAWRPPRPSVAHWVGAAAVVALAVVCWHTLALFSHSPS